MIFRSSSSSRTPLAAGVFAVGKYAGYPEFLRVAEGGEAFERLDGWIDEGFQGAYERWGADWKTTFPMGEAYGFLWRGLNDSHLCGVIAPSRDSIGRDYPLAVAARFPRELVARAPHIVPLAFGDFLDDAYRIVAEGRSMPMDIAEFSARVGGIAGATAEAVAYVEAEYGAWCQSTPVEEGWGAVFPGDRPLEDAAPALDALSAALSPFRGREAPDSSLVLRLPLGTGGAAAAALWLDVVRRICLWRATVPSAFWAVDSRSLVLPVGPVPSRTLAELWRRDPGSEFVCDVANAAPWSVRSAPSRSGRAAGGILRAAGAGASMSAFLDALVV